MPKTQYECKECPRWFTSKQGLSNHVGGSHTTRKCPVCGPVLGQIGPHLKKKHPEFDHLLREIRLENDWRIQEMDMMARKISDLQHENTLLKGSTARIKCVELVNV